MIMIVADWLKRLMNSTEGFSLFCDIKNDSEIQKSNKINEPFCNEIALLRVILSYLFVKTKQKWNEMNGQEENKKKIQPSKQSMMMMMMEK